jgi:hypothetical protein
MFWSNFFGLFGGMIASVIVGAISLLLINIWNDFVKRKELIIDIKNEIELNINKLNDLKELVLENLIAFVEYRESILNMSN